MAVLAYPEPGQAGMRRPGFDARHPADAWFFPAMLGLIWLLALGGFVPELIGRVLGDPPPYPLVIHVHAVVFFGWLSFLTLQVGLVRTGNIAWHRRMGVAGALLAVAVVIAGPAAALTMHMSHQARQPPQFLALQLLNIAVFAGMVTAGLLLRRRPAAHKRLMLIGTLALIGAGFGRIVRMLTGAPPPWTLIPSVYIAGNVLLLAIALHDWRTRGRLHPVFLPAAGAFLAVQLVVGLLLRSPGWAGMAQRIVS
jgi:hypothetical protein